MASKTIPSTSYIRPGPSHFLQAWQIFVFSSMFAVLLNAFYPDGIELKFRPPKKVNLSQMLKTTSDTIHSPLGFKDHSSKTTKTPLNPAPADSSRIPRLSLAGMKNRFDKKAVILLDARDPDHYKEGHIPGSVNFPANDLDHYAPLVMPQLTDKNHEIICYCDGGDCTLSLELAKTLIDQGFQKVEVFEGGWPQWKKSGYPVATGEVP